MLDMKKNLQHFSTPELWKILHSITGVLHDRQKDLNSEDLAGFLLLRVLDSHRHSPPPARLTDDQRKDIMKECYTCSFMEKVPGHCHIKCGNPDPDMIGDPHGIKHGWFYYPELFDPVWKLKKCCNFEFLKPLPGVGDD